jgi:arginine exporter protein ArgO
VNPLTFLYFGALMLGLPAAAAGSDRLFFALGAFGASLSWQLLLATAGALLHGRLPERVQVATRVLGSLVVLAFAAGLVLAAAHT